MEHCLQQGHLLPEVCGAHILQMSWDEHPERLALIDALEPTPVLGLGSLTDRGAQRGLVRVTSSPFPWICARHALDWLLKYGQRKATEPRTVPLMDSLAPILTAWKLKTGGEGLMFRPKDTTAGGRPDIGRPSTFIRPETMRRHLAAALKACNLPESLSWYHATRHTFASLFVLNGGSIELLRQLMGHSSVTTTERYSHLKPDLYRETIFTTMQVDLTKPAGKLVSLEASAPNGASEVPEVREGGLTG